MSSAVPDTSSPEPKAPSEAPAAPSRRRYPFGVALGGGGMKGWAHLGVLHVLESHGLKPDVMAGCSSGALAAAFYAAGHSLEDLQELMQEHQTSALFSIRFDGRGLLGNDDFRDYLQHHLGGLHLEDLPIPLSVVCTDLQSGREVVLNRGPVVEAIMASTAIPGVFAPARLNDRLLIDGGLTNNVPVSALVNRGARYTLGVRLHEGVTALAQPPQRRMPEGEQGTLSAWAERLTRTLRRDPEMPSGLEVLGRALDIVISQLEGYRLQAYHPDILIVPKVDHVGTLSMSEDPRAIYELGIAAAEAHSKALERLAMLLHGTSGAAPIDAEAS